MMVSKINISSKLHILFSTKLQLILNLLILKFVRTLVYNFNTTTSLYFLVNLKFPMTVYRNLGLNL